MYFFFGVLPLSALSSLIIGLIHGLDSLFQVPYIFEQIADVLCKLNLGHAVVPIRLRQELTRSGNLKVRWILRIVRAVW